MARQLLYVVPGVHIGPDSLTREELIKLVSEAYHEGQSSLTLQSTELSSLLEPSGIAMLQFLTDIYDCEYSKPSWKYSTKGSGRYELKNPYVTMLAATTPSYVAESLPHKATEHGFTARVIFVYEEKERHLNPEPKAPNKELVAALQDDLVEISQVKGKFRFDEEGKKFYHAYYKSIGTTAPADYRVEGFHWRKHRAHVLKLAMLYSLAEKNELVITEQDLIAARDTLELIEPRMARTFTAVGKYEHAVDLERLHKQIAEAGDSGIALSDLYRRNYHVGPLSVLDEMVAALTSMGKAKKMKAENGTVFLKAMASSELWEE